MSTHIGLMNLLNQNRASFTEEFPQIPSELKKDPPTPYFTNVEAGPERDTFSPRDGLAQASDVVPGLSGSNISLCLC